MSVDVRAITVKPPWSWAIAHGQKLVENRSQGTSYRGTLLIHAGKAWSARGGHDPRVVAAWVATGWPAAWIADQAVARLPLGAVVAVAQLVASHPDAGCCRPWGESSYAEAGGRVRTAVHHLVLEDVVPLTEPIPARGALGLWRPPSDLAAACASASAMPDPQPGGTR